MSKYQMTSPINTIDYNTSTYCLGDWVQKRSGGSWRGEIVGWYRTSLTPEGYAVESVYEPGSVQIYPVTALIPWDGR